MSPAPPIGERVAALETLVGTLVDEVKSLKRAMWGVVGSVVAGMILFLFSIASGWIGGGSGLDAFPF